MVVGVVCMRVCVVFCWRVLMCLVVCWCVRVVVCFMCVVGWCWCWCCVTCACLADGILID